LTSPEAPRILRAVRYISAQRPTIAPGDLVEMRGHLGHTVTTASNKKISLTGSFVVTRATQKSHVVRARVGGALVDFPILLACCKGSTVIGRWLLSMSRWLVRMETNTQVFAN